MTSFRCLITTNGFQLVSRFLCHPVILANSRAVVVRLVIASFGHFFAHLFFQRTNLGLLVLLIDVVQHLLVLLLRAGQNVPSNEARYRMPMVLPVFRGVICRGLRQRGGPDKHVRIEHDRTDRDQTDHDVVMEHILELVPLETRWSNGEILRSMASRHRTG
uniref:Uncharacterized protein n=1 Tax=Anopheles atroparvus TaxID=41427 RepID=A0AAG5DAA3_ANOAO